MIIISEDRLTIIDTDSGASIVAKERSSKYEIHANYPSCGLRTLEKDLPLDYAKALINEIFQGIQIGSPWMRINHLDVQEEATNDV